MSLNAKGSCCAVLSHSAESDSLQPRGLYPIRLLCPWDFSGKNIGVGCLSLLQGIFPTQDRTQVSRIAGRFITIWATREARQGITKVNKTSRSLRLDRGQRFSSQCCPQAAGWPCTLVPFPPWASVSTSVKWVSEAMGPLPCGPG